jgi:outer membrane protein assembly factor BamB
VKPVRILVLILCACVSVAWSQQPICAAYAPWAQFRKLNMERWNPCEKVLDVQNVGNLGLKWSYASGGGPSSPAVANGVVYVGSHSNNNVYALKASTDALLWSYTTGNEVWSSPAVANGVVYVGGDDFKVYAFGVK